MVSNQWLYILVLHMLGYLLRPIDIVSSHFLKFHFTFSTVFEEILESFFTYGDLDDPFFSQIFIVIPSK